MSNQCIKVEIWQQWLTANFCFSPAAATWKHFFFFSLPWIEHKAALSKENYSDPSALNLWNLGWPALWFVFKTKTNKDFLVTQEQKLGTRGHRARLKHSLGASAVLSLISNVKYFLSCSLWKKMVTSRAMPHGPRMCQFFIEDRHLQTHSKQK